MAYLDQLTVEQRDRLESLREAVRQGEFVVVNEFQPNGYLRSYSIGLTTYRLPEIIVFGLDEGEVTPFFDAYFAALHDPDKLAPYSDYKLGAVQSVAAGRLLPLLKCLFQDDFRLMQVILPKRSLAQANTIAGREYKQPRVWGGAGTMIPDLLVPPLVLAAEAKERNNRG